ncbi:hypothetical protein AGMMS49938_01350 [Fibrobacterales bacterium]|nr:hypothetical protein AGMMS49938_01350 [Fibrobacterales bacterium]
MKKLCLSCLILFSVSFATEAYQNQRALDSTAESLTAKKGIEIGGTVRGVSYNSYISSSQEKSSPNGRFVNQMPDHEIAEFVQLDLNFAFRPWDNITANMKLRLGAGSQEFFAPAATTINAPWLNVEGRTSDWFYWVVGDFRQSYSPLTLYMPGVDILYEPTIFARNREIAQKDALIDGNGRNLQGFNLQFRPNFGESIGELRVEALGARLRRAGYLDVSGANGNILPNERTDGSSQAATFDKFLGGGNIELLPLNKNVLVGGTILAIVDDSHSGRVYKYLSDGDTLANTSDTLPQKTIIFAGRAGADIASIIGSDKLILNLTGEFASSNDKAYNAFNITDENGDITGSDHNSEQISGSAILAQLDLGYNGVVKAVLSSSFIKNDSAWFNNVAQSPSFFARRILNSDKDLGCSASSCVDQSQNLSKYGVYSPLYSSFDALYFFTPKHSPMGTTLRNQAPLGQTQSYNTAPYTKNSWATSTYSKAELALIEELSDLNLQLSLPNGFATSNRQGFNEQLSVNWKNLAEVKAIFSNFEQLSAVNLTEGENAKKTKFSEYGGGAKVNVLGLLGFENNPLELSGSYKHSQKECESGTYGKTEFKSDFINAGLYYRFLKRFGVAFGYQNIASDLNLAGASAQKEALSNLKISVVPVLKSKQDFWMAGLDYTVFTHAWLSINYGILSVENTYDTRGIVDGDGLVQIDPINNLPNYLAVATAGQNAEKLKHKFSRDVIEATINVEF